MRFSELFTSSLVGKATPLKDIAESFCRRILRLSQVTTVADVHPFIPIVNLVWSYANLGLSKGLN